VSKRAKWVNQAEIVGFAAKLGVKGKVKIGEKGEKSENFVPLTGQSDVVDGQGMEANPAQQTGFSGQIFRRSSKSFCFALFT
jgi:hypothetical protein